MRFSLLLASSALAALATALTGCSSADCAETGTCTKAASSSDGGPASVTDFELAPVSLPAIQPGSSAQLNVVVRRVPANTADISVSVDSLPPGLTATPAVIPGAEAHKELTLSAAVDAKQGAISFTIVAKAGDTFRTAKVDTLVRGKPGDVDVNFGNGGHVNVLGNSADEVRAVLVGPSDEIYVVATCRQNEATLGVCVVKLSAEGVVDPFYGNTNNLMPDMWYAPASFLDSAGRVVVGGSALTAAKPRLSRFDTTGRPDATVGVLTLETGLPDFYSAGPIESMAPCQDGSFYVTFSHRIIEVMRFTSALAKDTGFSSDGLESISALEGNATVVCDTDGAAFLSGGVANDSGFLRLLKSGVADTSVGPSGARMLGAHLGSFYIGVPPPQFADGQIVTLFDAENTISVTKTSNLGTLTGAYGSSGIATVAKAGTGAYVGSFLVDKALRTVLIFREPDVEHVVRLLANGSKDPSFGEAGVRRTLSPGASGSRGGLQSDGKIVVATHNQSTKTVSITRLWQ